jgi:hypothetical protein
MENANLFRESGPDKSKRVVSPPRRQVEVGRLDLARFHSRAYVDYLQRQGGAAATESGAAEGGTYRVGPDFGSTLTASSRDYQSKCWVNCMENYGPTL